jgi:hypothetical protein
MSFLDDANQGTTWPSSRLPGHLTECRFIGHMTAVLAGFPAGKERDKPYALLGLLAAELLDSNVSICLFLA